MGRIAYAALLAFILIGHPHPSHPQEEAKKPEPNKPPEPRKPEPLPGKPGYSVAPHKSASGPPKPPKRLDSGHSLDDFGKKEEIKRAKNGSTDLNSPNKNHEENEETEEHHHEHPGPCEDQKTNSINNKRCLNKQPNPASKQGLNPVKPQSPWRFLTDWA